VTFLPSFLPSVFLPQVMFKSSEGGLFTKPVCPVIFTLEYGTVYSSLPFRIWAVINILISFGLFVAWVYWVYWKIHVTPLMRVVERDWLTLFLVGLLLYSNPVYCFAQWFSHVSKEKQYTKSAENVCLDLLQQVLSVY